MSFQHFRIQPVPPPQHIIAHSINPPGPSTSSASDSSLSQALGHTQPLGPTPTIVQGFHLESIANGLKKAPYGSGDIDDGYTLVFESMDAFQAWRQKEEEEKMVEFVKGDTHGSKAVPPRFKDHTKLVCARHSRSGRKKYVKKYPERVRKVPSRKIEGAGCPASISYKTYFDNDEVRACYVSEHSHEIGLANLPFTRRGRKAQAQQARSRRLSNLPPLPSHPPHPMSEESDESPPPPMMHTHMNAIAGPSNLIPHSHTHQHQLPHAHTHPQPQPQSQPHMVPAPTSVPTPIQTPIQTSPGPIAPIPIPARAAAPLSQLQQHAPYQHTVSMAPAPMPQPAPQPPPPPPPSHMDLSQERWDRMSVLFQNIRERARGFEYPAASVAALETVLIRLFLESPVGGGVGGVSQPMMNGIGDSMGT